MQQNSCFSCVCQKKVVSLQRFWRETQKPEGVLLHNSELTKSGKFHRKGEVIAFCVYMLSIYQYMWRGALFSLFFVRLFQSLLVGRECYSPRFSYV